MSGLELEVIEAYARRCLDALGVRFRPACLEIILSEDGPILIDMAGRLCGDQDYYAIHDVAGRDALSLCVAGFADAPAYREMVSAPSERHGHIGYVGAFSHDAGRIGSDAWQADIRAIPSFRSFGRMPKIDDRLVPTIDLATVPVFIWLVADNLDDVLRDYRRIRDMERRPGGVFRNSLT